MANRLTPLGSIVAAPARMLADVIVPHSIAARSTSDLDTRRLEEMLGLPAGSVFRGKVRGIDHGTSLRVQLEILHGDTSTSVFIKHTPTRVAARLFNLVARLCEHEVHFYRDIAGQLECAPTALATQWHPGTGRSTLMLPDLGRDGYEFLELSDVITGDQAALAIEAMAGLHRTFWRDRRIDRTGEYLPENSFSRFGMPLLCRLLGKAPQAIAEHLPTGFLGDLDVLRTHAQEMNFVFNSFDQTLLHNDSHQGNVAYGSDKAMLVDWQVCCRGSALKDFAYFMSCIDSNVRRAQERDLLNLYLDMVSAGDGPVVPWDEAWTAYRILAITGFIAAATTTLFGDRLQNAGNAAVSLQRSVSSLIDLESFKAVEHVLAA
jgi:Phosphotransferase enzyme family